MMLGHAHDPNKAFLMQLKKKNLKPVQMMMATRPAQNIQILFQTHKMLSNLPSYMFEADDNPNESPEMQIECMP